MKKRRLSNSELSVMISEEIEKQSAVKFNGIVIKEIIIVEKWDYPDTVIAINFDDCIFLDDCTFYGNKLEKNIAFKSCDFLKDIYFLNVELTKLILLTECKVQGALTLADCTMNHFATYTTSIDHLMVIDCTIKKIQIGGKLHSYIKDIRIHRNNSIDKIEIANSKIERVSFSFLPEDTEIFNCLINSLLFQKVRNSKNLKLLNCKSLPLKDKLSHFISDESNLGKAEFFQFDFATFNEVNIINSVLNDCLFINTTWSDNIKSFSGDQMDNYLKDRTPYYTPLSKAIEKFTKQQAKPVYKETKEQLKDKREVYKQIKYALSKQGDIVNEQMFHALEMNTYNLILDKTPKNISTKIILSLSSISSNYGQSLLRPIIFLLIVNGIFFSLLNFFNGLKFIPVSTITFDNVLNTTAKFLWYLNPFHKSDELRGLPSIVDIFIRIVSSYSLYNIVRATRRFIK